jgi:hypothetical protein
MGLGCYCLPILVEFANVWCQFFEETEQLNDVLFKITNLYVETFPLVINARKLCPSLHYVLFY